MSQQLQKEQVAAAAIDRLASLDSNQIVLGVGTGSTADCFIERLVPLKGRIDTTVASSERTADALRKLGLPVSELNEVSEIDLYVDGEIKAGAGANLIDTAVRPFNIGRRVDNTSQYWNGYVDEIGIWKTPVAEAKIVEQYKVGRTRKRR